MLAKLGILARRGFGRIVPEPFVIAILLTAVVIVMALLSGSNPIRTLTAWGAASGVWNLLAFAMQMSVMLIFGSALAESPPVHRGLVWVVRVARSPRQLVALTALVSASLGVLNWSLGLIGGALVARAAGHEARRRDFRLHYPLLCAAGYCGLMVWHGGLSGSAPLKATSAKDLDEVLGPELAARVGVIPLDISLFGELNLWVTGGLLCLAPLVFAALTPVHDPDPAEPPEEGTISPRTKDLPPANVVDHIERSSSVALLLALLVLGAAILHIQREGIGRFDFNTLNLVLWGLALLAHRRPDRFLQACERGVIACSGVMVQFPLYAGVMAVMNDSGLSVALSRLISSAGASVLPVMTFLSAGIVNLFVPSGGGQWVVQGPILARAGLELGVPVSDLMMAMAYGDQWTNMIQPFWALPLLAITGARARDIVGYCAIWMGIGGLWIALQLWLQV